MVVLIRVHLTGTELDIIGIKVMASDSLWIKRMSKK
jgi:hypothetical protein